MSPATDAASARYVELRVMLDDQLARLTEVLENELADFNEMLRDRGKPPVGPIP